MYHSRFLKLIVFFCLFVFTLSWATDFSVNPNRFDPYRQFKFRVKWDGRYVSGIIRVNGLHRTTAVIANTDSENGTRSPGRTVYEPIILERGRTHDTEFEKWANKVYEYGSHSSEPQHDYRKNIIIELYNEAGQKALAFKVYNCWPSHYSPVKALDSNNTDMAVEVMVLEHDGWERDTDVTEPAQRSFTEP